MIACKVNAAILASLGETPSMMQGVTMPCTVTEEYFFFLEFGASDGSYSRAYTSTQMVTDAIRADECAAR
jgi:hypothetical protein